MTRLYPGVPGAVAHPRFQKVTVCPAPVDPVLLAPLRRVGTLAATDEPQAGPVSRVHPPQQSAVIPCGDRAALEEGAVERWS
jgi:hypothetical protein